MRRKMTTEHGSKDPGCLAAWFAHTSGRIAGVVTLITLALISTTAAPAAASCNGMEYNYAEYFSSPHNYRGLERFISTPAARLFDYNNEHILFWFEVEYPNNPGENCPYGACWVQIGLGAGHTGNALANSLQVYWENTGPGNYYLAQYFPSFSIPQNTFYTVFFTGFNAYNQANWATYEASSYVNGGTTFNADNYVAAAAEAWSSNTIGVHCPHIDTGNNFVYFGTHGNGVTDAGVAMYNSFNGQTWSEWTGAIQPPTQQYEFHLLRANSAFSARGGTD